jgi:hypothetical protein
MSHPNKVRGWRGERNHRDAHLRDVWPRVDFHRNRQHPTKDHEFTGNWHVQSKARKTWNIKDVVRWMFEKVPHKLWLVVYSDGDKRKADAIKLDVVIMPASTGMMLLDHYENHDCEVGDDWDPPSKADIAGTYH